MPNELLDDAACDEPANAVLPVELLEDQPTNDIVPVELLEDEPANAVSPDDELATPSPRQAIYDNKDNSMYQGKEMSQRSTG